MYTAKQNYENFSLTHQNKFKSKSPPTTLPKELKIPQKPISGHPKQTSRQYSIKAIPPSPYFKSFAHRSNSTSKLESPFRILHPSHKNSKFSLSWIIYCLIRNFEQDQFPDDRIEACKTIKKWVKVSAKSFPRALCAALVALSGSDSDDLQEFAQELLRILSIKNCEVLVACGGLQVLIKKLLDPRIPQALSENIGLTLTFLINEPQTRQFFNNGREVLRIFSVFTDYEAGLKESEQGLLLKAARKALVLMIRSWAGLIYLTGNGLESLVKTLNHPIKPLIKEEILEMFYEMLSIQTDTTCVSYNLMNNYLAMLIKAFLHCGIFEGLIKLTVDEHLGVRNKSAKLMEKIWRASADLFPNPPLLPLESGSKKFRLLNEFAGRCEKSGIVRKVNILSEAVEFVNAQFQRNEGEVTRVIFQNFYLNFTNESMVSDMIDNSRFVEKVKEWNWEVILQLLSGPLATTEIFMHPKSQQFLKNLLAYFSPSKNLFHILPWHPAHFPKAKAGMLLLQLLLTKEEGCSLLTSIFTDSFFQPRKSFLSELSESIEEELQFNENLLDSTSRVLTCDKVKSCMAREYFIWIGVFLNSKAGRFLLKSHKIQQSLQSLHRIEHLAVLLMPLLDYSKKNWQCFLELALESSLFVKFKVIEQIRNLFRDESSDLPWIIGNLKSLLFHTNQTLVSSTLSLLDELCTNEQNLHALILTGPQELFSLGDPGKKILFHFLKTSEGLEYLHTLDFIPKELKLWHNSHNTLYARRIEESIEQGLDPPKSNYSLSLPSPKDCKSQESIAWISKLPLTICIVTSKRRRYEIEPVVLSTPEGIELQALIDMSFFITEGISAGLMLGMSYIDSQGNESFDECLVHSPRHLFEGLIFEKEGVRFEFTEPSKPRLVSVAFIVKIVSKHLPVFKMPPHLFGELSQTAEGLKVLEGSGYLQEYCLKLKKSYQTLQKRAFLWALGHTGNTNLGAMLLIKLSAIRLITEIAEKTPVLSLRGSAFQSLALICRSWVGRKELLRLGWTCNEPFKACIALPKDPSVLFCIEKSREFLPFFDKLEHLEKFLWKNKLGKVETEVFSLICSLGSIVHKTKSEVILKNLRKNSPGVFLSQRLLHSVMEVLAGYQFSLQTRRFIHKLFDLLPQAPLIEFDAYRSML